MPFLRPCSTRGRYSALFRLARVLLRGNVLRRRGAIQSDLMSWYYAVVPRELVLPSQRGNSDLQTPTLLAAKHAERPVAKHAAEQGVAADGRREWDVGDAALLASPKAA